MKFSDINELFSKCIEHYAEETQPDDECNVIIIFSDSKRGMTLSNDETLAPETAPISSDVAMKRVGLMATALWCSLQRDYGNRAGGSGIIGLASLLGALGGSQAEPDDQEEQGPDSEIRLNL